MALTDSLVAHWKLNEASGTRNDSHGANHLTDNNTVLSAAGKIGDGADFESTNSEYLSIADNADVSLGADVDFTWAMWFKPESTAAQRGLIGKRSGTAPGNAEYRIEHSSAGVLQFIVGNGTTGATLTSTTTFSAGTWYFIVCWHDSVANKLFVQVNNGTPDEVAWSGGTQDTSSGLEIGRLPTSAGTALDGVLDSVSFWKRALTSDERTALYGSGSGLDYPFSSSKQIACAVPAVSQVAAIPRIRRRLIAAVTGGAALVCVPRRRRRIAAGVVAQSVVVASISGQTRIAAAVSGASGVTAVVRRRRRKTCAVGALCSVSGSLRVRGRILAGISGTAGVAAVVRRRVRRACGITGVSTIQVVFPIPAAVLEHIVASAEDPIALVVSAGDPSPILVPA